MLIQKLLCLSLVMYYDGDVSAVELGAKRLITLLQRHSPDQPKPSEGNLVDGSYGEAVGG